MFVLVVEKTQRGVRPWLMFWVATLTFTLIYSQRVCISAITTLLMAHLHVSANAIGSMAATQFFIYMVLQIPSGILGDTIGPRKMLTSGAFLVATGTLIFALAPTYPVAFAGRALLGVGDACIYVNISRLVFSWFSPKRTGLLISMVYMAAGVGGFLATYPLAVSVNTWGIPSTFIAISFLIYACSLGCLLFVRSTPHPQSHDIDIKWVFKSLRDVLINPATWPVLLVGAAIGAGPAAFASVWGIQYLAQSYNVSQTTAAGVFALDYLGIIVGGLCIGYAATISRSRRLVLTVSMFGSLALWALLVFGGSFLNIFTAGTVIFLIAIFSAASNIATVQAKEVNKHENAGMTVGIYNAGTYIFISLLQYLFGVVLDLQWQGKMVDGYRIYPPEAYTHMLWLVLALAGLGSICCLILPRSHPESDATVKS